MNKNNYRVYIKDVNIIRDVVYFESDRKYGEPLIKYWDHPSRSMAEIKGHVGTIYKKDGVLLQSTGMLDNKGVEIYEGDILQSPNGKYHMLIEFIGSSFTADGENLDIFLKYNEDRIVAGNRFKDVERLGLVLLD